jgi:hypothetical protein
MKFLVKHIHYILFFLCLTVLMGGCNKDPEIKIYTYPSPVPTGLSPVSGYPGIDVTITGKDFGTYKNAVSVFFGNIKADTVRSCTDGQIVVRVPAGAISGKVTLKIWTHTLDSIGSYAVIPAPVVKSVSTAAGAPGDVISLRGTGFGTDLTKLNLSFNGTMGTINTVVNDTLITATVPTGFTSGALILFVNGFPVKGPSFVYLTPVQNPVYQLDFDGNLTDKMGGTAAIYTQGLGSPLSYVAGINGQAVLLAGYANAGGGTSSGFFNQIIALPANIAQYNELTVSCWVNCPALTDWTPIFEFGATRGNRLCLLERAASWWSGSGNNMVGRVIFEKVTGFPAYQETNDITTASMPDKGWHFVAMTISKTNLKMKIYLDGTLIGTQALPSGYDVKLYNQDRAYIGANTFGTANEPSFGGSIDKFQIFNAELNANEINTLYFKK